MRSGTELSQFLRLFLPSLLYNKNDDCDFDIVNFPSLDAEIPRSTSYGVNISQLI